MKSCGRVTINLSVVAENWERLDALCKAEAGAVIKDNAYGLGAAPIARALYAAGCRTFFFITPEEAAAALDFLPTDIRTIILGGFRPENQNSFADPRLIPVIHSFESLQRWLNFTDRELPRPCVLKFDTGMSRLGFAADDCVDLVALSSSLNPVMIMSHLACADQPDHPLNIIQLKQFRAITSCLKPVFPDARLSLANSAGILLGDAWHFDVVRPGAGLYGINTNQSLGAPLRNAVTLELPVLQVRSFGEPITVGYDATESRAAGSRLVVVAGGYADGINRVLGAQPHLMYKNHAVTAVGKMSMDSFILDFSLVPDEELPAVGEYLPFISDALPLDYWIKHVGSLGYEILTALGPRLERIYC